MSKIIVKENFRIVVTPTIVSAYIRPAHPAYESPANREANILECENILCQIRRHIDNATTLFLWDTIERCEFCDGRWEGDSEPACCDEAIDEWDKTVARNIAANVAAMAALKREEHSAPEILKAFDNRADQVKNEEKQQ